jgi:glycosyltransferase involved in cell wall biosynthesis
VGEPLSKKIKNYCNREIKVIPNMVDCELFNYNKKKFPNKPYKLISVGSLVHNKVFDILIKAIAAVKNDVQLLIIGEGVERKKLEKMIIELKLSDRIKLIGRCDRLSVAKYMGDSDIFVLASKFETFGIVFIEALASGIPVVATACGGPESFIDETNGRIVPINDPSAFAEAVDYVIERYDSYDHLNIRKECIDKFSENTVIEQLGELYVKLLNK